MMETSPLVDAALRVSIQLLDSSHGKVVQTWQFDGRSSITLGRASERDVRVGDQHVSRLHAEVLHEDGAWTLVAHGRNGLLVDNRKVDRVVLQERTVFRLGPEGPMLAVRFERVTNDSLATLDTSSMPVLAVKIDEDRKAREVAEIASGDYFKELRTRAIQLRSRR
jgi:pSer/pThr/pTyr-binding forkhead associated (FHA) protein